MSHLLHRQTLSYQALLKGNVLAQTLFHQALPLYHTDAVALFRDCGGPLQFLLGMMYEADAIMEAGRTQRIPFAQITAPAAQIEAVLATLQERGLSDPRTAPHLRDTLRYWEILHAILVEGQLAPALLQQWLDVIPCDVAACHVLCHELLRLPLSEAKLQAIRHWEMILNIDANRMAYPHGVVNDDFNLFGLYVQIYGDAAEVQFAQERATRMARFAAHVENLDSDEREAFRAIMQASPQLNESYFQSFNRPVTANLFPMEPVNGPDKAQRAID